MTKVACGLKKGLVLRSSMHPCPGNWVAVGPTVVYYVRAVHQFSAGIKCRHCICTFMAKLTTAFIRAVLYTGNSD